MTNQYDNYPHSDLTEKILKCVHAVHRRLGYGFFEKVYENALMIVLQRAGLKATQQVPSRAFEETCVLIKRRINNRYTVRRCKSNKVCEVEEPVSQLPGLRGDNY